MSTLLTDIRFLKGVGEKRAQLLNRLGIDTIGALLRYYPRAYEDFSRVTPIFDCNAGEKVCVKARLVTDVVEHYIRKNMTLYKFTVTDGTANMSVTIFNNKYAAQTIKVGSEILLYGKLSTDSFYFEMSSPQIRPVGFDIIRPIYPTTYKLTSSAIEKAVKMAKMMKADVTTADIPIIFCTARDTEDDMVMGLNLGADDYIMKPYTVRNVIARVKSVLRRTSGNKSNAKEEKPNVLKVDGLELDLEFKRCVIDGEEVKLARKEFELLAYLISHQGKICSREQILSRVWSDEVVVLDRTIDVNITRLRSKIGAYGSYIVTRSGFGYGFRD